MRRSTTCSALFFGLALCLASVLPAAAQQSDAPAFGEIVDVRVINLEVVVTEGRQRVEGLSSEDFRLLVDGREVPIEYFTEVRHGSAVAASGAAPEATAVPALQPGEAVGTRFLVFVDETFLIPAHRNRVLRELAEQVPLLGPDDHMAVVAFDGSRIDLLSSWTSNHRELERVLDEATDRKAYGLLNRNRLEVTDPYYLSSVRFARDSFLDPSYRYVGVPRGSRSVMLADRVVDAATTTLRGFADPPGRKVMLLVSGGWPTATWEAFSSIVSYGYSNIDADRRFGPLVDTANRLGYTLYPIDAKGLESHFAGAEYRTFAAAELAGEVLREREWIEEGALIQLARETGGRAHIDGASLKALERTIDDTRSYYWLGFTPDWRENDERHKVKVEVLGKGMKVRSRKSFSDLSRQTEVTMLVESSQLFDLPVPGEEADLGVSFGEPSKGGFRKVVLPVRLEIPLDRVTMLPENGGWGAQLELRIGATDDRGERADIPVVPVEVHVEESPQAGAVAVYEVGLKLRNRPHRLLLTLHDPASGAILSKRLDLSL